MKIGDLVRELMWDSTHGNIVLDAYGTATGFSTDSVGKHVRMVPFPSGIGK